MRKFKTYTSVTIDHGLCIGLAVAFLVIPVRLLLSWCCAVIVHELGHWVALRILNVPIISVSLSARGIEMDTENMLPHEEFFSAAAGPVCSMLLLLTAKWLPFIAFCGVIQGAFNLLPVLPLDGGRMLRSLIELCFPGRGRITLKLTNYAVRVLLLIAILFLLYAGILPAATFVVILLYRFAALKIPCKDDSERVQ